MEQNRTSVTGNDAWGAVLTGGDGPALRHARPLLARCSLTIAADSGFDLARRYGLTPDWVVGDMDSLSDQSILDTIPENRVLRFRHEKDETDTEIAVRLLAERGYRRIAVVGGGGGRLDHLVAILSLFSRETRPSLWLTDREFVYSVDDEVRLLGYEGWRVSFFPAGCECSRMHSTGLQWNLDGLQWRQGDVGVSNRIIDDLMHVTMEHGRILMVAELEMLTGILA